MNQLGILLNADSGSEHLGGSETISNKFSRAIYGIDPEPTSEYHSKVLKKCSKVKEKESIWG